MIMPFFLLKIVSVCAYSSCNIRVNMFQYISFTSKKRSSHLQCMTNRDLVVTPLEPLPREAMRNTSEDRRTHKTFHSVSSSQQSMRHGEIDVHLQQTSCQRWVHSQVSDIEPEKLFHQSRPTFSGGTNIAGCQDHNAHSLTIPAAKKEDRLVCRARNSSRRRKSRYLTKPERSEIITRIKDGEKQAYLANEYAVSRAAICNLYKKYKSQKEVTDRTTPDESRLHSPIRTPSESLQSETMQEKQSRLFQMDSHSVPIRNILQMLNDQRVSSFKFRHLVDRLVRLLIEEAVAYVSRSFCTSNSGVQLHASEWEDQNICGILMRGKVDEDVMLRAFAQLYPWSKFGSVSLTFWDACRGDSLAPTCIIQFDLDIIKGVQYFLLDLDCVTGEEVCAVVQRLVTQYHIQESDIYYVALFSSAAGVQRLAWQFPRISVFCTNLYDDHFSSFSSVYRDVFYARYWLQLAPCRTSQETIV